MAAPRFASIEHRSQAGFFVFTEVADYPVVIDFEGFHRGKAVRLQYSPRDGFTQQRFQSHHVAINSRGLSPGPEDVRRVYLVGHPEQLAVWLCPHQAFMGSGVIHASAGHG